MGNLVFGNIMIPLCISKYHFVIVWLLYHCSLVHLANDLGFWCQHWVFFIIRSSRFHAHCISWTCQRPESEFYTFLHLCHICECHLPDKNNSWCKFNSTSWYYQCSVLCRVLKINISNRYEWQILRLIEWHELYSKNLKNMLYSNTALCKNVLNSQSTAGSNRDRNCRRTISKRSDVLSVQ